MDTSLLTQFCDLETQKRALEVRLAQVKERQEALEAPILEHFSANGIQNVQVNGFTLYIHRQWWARPRDGDQAAACAALRAVELHDLVRETCNAAQVSAYVRELKRQKLEVPEPVEAAFVITEAFSLRAQKAS